MKNYEVISFAKVQKLRGKVYVSCFLFHSLVVTLH